MSTLHLKNTNHKYYIYNNLTIVVLKFSVRQIIAWFYGRPFQCTLHEIWPRYTSDRSHPTQEILEMLKFMRKRIIFVLALNFGQNRFQTRYEILTDTFVGLLLKRLATGPALKAANELGKLE